MKKQIFTAGAVALLSALNLRGSNPPLDCDPPPNTEETTISPIKFNTEKLMKIGKALGTALEVASAGSWKYSPGTGVDLEFKVKQKELCCSGEIKKVDKYSGSLGFDAGKVSGSGPVPLLYYPGIGFVWSIGVSFSAKGTVNTEYPDCDGDPDKCGSVSVKCEASGKVTGLIINADVISISGGFTANAEPTAKYCIDSGLAEPEFCLKVNCKVSATFVWTTIQIYDGKIYSNCD